jgi:hypothetical protein
MNLNPLQLQLAQKQLETGCGAKLLLKWSLEGIC